MSNPITRTITRRRWAHVQACIHFGRRHHGIRGWWARRRQYDALFRIYCRIGALMQAHGNQLDI